MTAMNLQQNSNYEDPIFAEAEGFQIKDDEFGVIYDWDEYMVEAMPTHKLESIIELSEQADTDVDPTYLDAVIVELLSRRAGMVC